MKSSENPKKLTIAIDGHSSCGKSTLAKEIANEIGYVYIDSGAMYRGVALYCLRKNWVSKEHLDSQTIIAHLSDIQLRFVVENEREKPQLELNGELVESEIRSLEVSQVVSPIATLKEVRTKLVDEQRKMGELGGVIMDGRDIGSVVFPHADLKIFLTARPEIRAKRRFDELKMAGTEASLEDVQANLLERDQIDSTRAESPLIQTADAWVIDNSNLTRAEQLQLVLDKIKKLTSHKS